MLPRWYKPRNTLHLSSAQIIARVAALHDLAIDDITGPARSGPICTARRQAARELRDRGLSFPRIGKALNRHHATVLRILQG